MDFRDYVLTLQEIVGGSQSSVVRALFKNAGAPKPNEETAKSWIKKGSYGKRNCSVKTYFSDERVNETQFIEYMRGKVNTNWKNLQIKFRSMADDKDDKIVDVDTDNEERFYWSLLNQFQKILGLPLSAFPGNDPSAGALPPESMCNCFCNAVEDFPIEIFLNSDQIDSLPDYRVWDASTFFGRMNAMRKKEDAPDRDTAAYQSIVKFLDALEDYLWFLRVNSIRPDAFPDDFHLMGNSVEVHTKGNQYRQKAKDLFDVAYLAAKAAKMEREAEHSIREAENPSPHPGEYAPPPDEEKHKEKFKVT